MKSASYLQEHIHNAHTTSWMNIGHTPVFTEIDLERTVIVHLPTPHFRPLPLYAKIASIVVIIGFVIIGVIGLLLPVIPGVVFLFLAVLLATRVSRRVSKAAHANPWFREHMHTWKTSSQLPVGRKLMLSVLLFAKGLVDGARAVGRVVKRSLAR